MNDKKSVSTKLDKEEKQIEQKIHDSINRYPFYYGEGREFDDRWARILYNKAFLIHKDRLKGINLDNVSTSREEIINLINNLSCLTNLRSLSLKHSDVGNEGLEALSEQKDVLSRLVVLSLWGSNFSPLGFLNFTDCFSSLTNLQTLYLSQTTLSDMNGIILAQRMKECKYLQKLFVNGTSMGVEGVKAIIENIHCLPNIQTVCLKSNRLDEEDIHSYDYIQKTFYLEKLIALEVKIIALEKRKIFEEENIQLDISVSHEHEAFVYKEFVKCGDVEYVCSQPSQSFYIDSYKENIKTMREKEENRNKKLDELWDEWRKGIIDYDDGEEEEKKEENEEKGSEKIKRKHEDEDEDEVDDEKNNKKNRIE